MKTIGMIGGTSWVSTIDYYRLLNEGVNHFRGGNEAARIILHSLNFGEVIALNDRGDQEGVYRLLHHAALALQNAGADMIMLCANTMHLHAERLMSEIRIPLVHIAEETAKVIRSQNLGKVALLGTRITMERNFYRDKLREAGIETLVPDETDRIFIHQSVFAELGKNIFLPETRERYLHIIDQLREKGARGVILGCTEIPLLLKPGDIPIPSFDTTSIHANAAVRLALGNDI